MQTHFSIHKTTVTPAHGEGGDSGRIVLHARGECNVKEIVRFAVRELGMDKRNHSDPWFASAAPKWGCGRNKRAVAHYYSLHLGQLSPRALLRVDQMIDIVQGRVPYAL